MTLIYQATDGSTAASVSGSGPFAGTPWDVARAGTTLVARPTTRQAIYNRIRDALIAAGWTQFNKIAVDGTRHDVFESNGESGTDNLCISIQQFTTGRWLVFNCAPKMDASNNLVKLIGLTSAPGAASLNNWDLTAADFTSDFQILANKDYIWAVFQNINHTAAMHVMFMGALKPVDSNINTLLLSGGIVAGDHVLIPVTTNPIVAGFRPGDVVQILNSPKTSTARCETTQIVEVQAAAVRVRAISQGAYDTGARLGMMPCSIARFVGQNDELDTGAGVTNNFTSPLMFSRIQRAAGDFAADNALPSGQLLDAVDYALLNTHAQAGTEFGSGATGNNRTLRFTCRTVMVGSAPNNALGKVPGLISFPGTGNYYPHDYGRDDRISPQRDYTAMRFTATSTRPFMLGPTPM